VDNPYEDHPEVEEVYEHKEEEPQSNEFKPHRKFLFMLGKGIKWTLWAAFALYMYHMYLVVKKDKPEEAFLANEYFLRAAGFTHYNYEMLTILLTRPPVDKLLMDRPPLPPGYQNPKVLVLNLDGTLIHSEYKFGVGFELLKRPGLAMFLSTMARNFEVVIFGD
jgi:import inner membrane translocase subunit TIM50